VCGAKKKAPQVFEIGDPRLRETEEYRQDSEEALLETADESKHGMDESQVDEFVGG
jgi:hypothetical protein